jgi:hypothetical protein
MRRLGSFRKPLRLATNTRNWGYYNRACYKALAGSYEGIHFVGPCAKA